MRNRLRPSAGPARPARVRSGRAVRTTVDRRPAIRLRVVWLVGAAALAAAVGSAIALGGAPRWAPPTVPADLVVARVHGEDVRWSAIVERLDAATVMGRPVPADRATWRAQAHDAIESLVRDVLARHTMQALGSQVTEAAIDAQIQGLRDQYGGDGGLQEAMAAMDVSMAQLRETQSRGLYLQAMIDRFVPATDADVDAYLAQPGAAGLTRSEAAARVRAERASQVIPGLLDQLRNDPGVWVIDTNGLG